MKIVGNSMVGGILGDSGEIMSVVQQPATISNCWVDKVSIKGTGFLDYIIGRKCVLGSGLENITDTIIETNYSEDSELISE